LLDIAEPLVQINSWLFRVAKNKIYDRYRKKKTLSSEALGMDDEDRWLDRFDYVFNEGEERIQAQEILDHVYSAIDQLPDNQREVFIMHEIEEMSFAEISELLDVNQNTLLSRKRYAIQSLRKQLSNYYEEFKN
jgi:RNA polymerase sigma factor (sigma-70 family)